MVKSAVRVYMRVRPCAGLNPHAQYYADQKAGLIEAFNLVTQLILSQPSFM